MFPLPQHNETYSFAKRNSGHLIEFFFMNFSDFITVRNEVAKVMFLQVCVCPQGGLLRGGCPVPRWGVLVRGVVPGPRGGLLRGVGIPAWTEADHPGRDGYCCGRYASYWNAFLFELFVLFSFQQNPRKQKHHLRNEDSTRRR